MYKIIIINLIFQIFLHNGQTLRYFEFKNECGSVKWQDTAFIAATSNLTLINEVLDEINKPYENRRFINGKITNGNGTYNNNSVHWFKWHFIENEWVLTALAAELCDGCPFSDVDSDTAYWIGKLGQFCPWSSKPLKEINNPSDIGDENFHKNITTPNTANDYIENSVGVNSGLPEEIGLYDVFGEKVNLTSTLSEGEGVRIDVSSLATGLYFVRIGDLVEKFIKN